jgi:polyhydroxybutyrate depolymerase
MLMWTRHNPVMRPWARSVAVAATMLCLLPAAACRWPEPPPSPPSPAPTGTSVHTLDVDGLRRSYRLYVPADVTSPAPLVFTLHGGFGTAQHAQEHYGWVAAADLRGFVVAFPDGHGRAWNVGGGCCGEPGRTGVDDVAFIAAVAADVAARVSVDPERIYATGMSNGAMLAYRLACDLPTAAGSDLPPVRLAAIAPVAGTLLGTCPSPAPTSVLHIHGLTDARVRFDGAPGTGVAKIDGPDIPSVLAMWRSVDACPEPRTHATGVVTTLQAECPQGMDVVLVTVADAGHQWPGSTTGALQELTGADPPSTAFDATALIADFFLAHP